MTTFRRGQKAELYLLEKLRDRGMRVAHYQNRYYDILVNKKIRIEVKSCLLSVRQINSRTKRDSFRIGRFNFEKKNQNKKILKYGVWVCFITRWNDEMMILGFIQPFNINKRYIRFCDLRDLKLWDINEFCSFVQNEIK